jgi:hypothetical protein
MLASNVSFCKVYDLILMILLAIFFVVYVNIHSDLLGLPHFLPTSDEIEKLWESFTWLIFAMLALDIYLKYRKADDVRSFLKKHWLEVAMLALVPLFAGLKVAKISIKLVKGMKMMKSGFKVAHGAKKMTKQEKTSESASEPS